MATTYSKNYIARDVPNVVQVADMATIVAGIETTVDLKGPSGVAPYRVDYIVTTRATSGDPIFLQWVIADNDVSSTPNTITLRPDTVAGGSLDGMVCRVFIEWMDSASGGIG